MGARSTLERGPVLSWKESRMTCAAISADGRVLVTAGNTATLRFWYPASGLRLASRDEPRSLVLSLSVSADGRSLAAGTVAGGIELWDLATGRRQADLPAHSAGLFALAFSPDVSTCFPAVTTEN